MNHIEYSFKADAQTAEIIIALLSDAGMEGVEELLDGYKIVLNDSAENQQSAKSVFAQYNVLFTMRSVSRKNWNEQWESGFKPVVVGNFACIRAGFHGKNEAVKHDIIITPKMSFGTGHHETTYMMVEQMEKLKLHNKNVFDFGTGTGVLAILAEKCGAGAVKGIDIDDWSIENAAENAVMNGCKLIKFSKESYPVWDIKADVILANINLNILVENLDAMKEIANAGARILLSGILLQDLNTIKKALQETHINIDEYHEKGKWILVSCTL